jgi:hypothetical protein
MINLINIKTDLCSDIGDYIEIYNCGKKVISGDITSMKNAVEDIIKHHDLNEMGENAWRLLMKEFHVDRSYSLIMDRIKNKIENV